MRTLLARLALLAGCALIPFTACIPKGGPVPQSLPPAPPTRGVNPFTGAKLLVDRDSQAAQQLHNAAGKQATALKLIADQPQADWLGEWTPNIEMAVRQRVSAAQRAGALRVMIAYNIPNRDCGQYSQGGLADPAEYRQWITEFARGIGQAKAVVILEPDSLGQLKECLTPADQQARLDLLQYAVRTLRQNPGTAVYLDAGNANWIAPAEMAKRLEGAGIKEAHGFSVNVSNYVATDKTVAYSKQISQALGGGVGFVVDTSRNGQGEAPDQAWCNPPGRGLGQAPTPNTGDPLIHAFLWLKRPGESDGTCNGGPPAGQWFMKQAMELARNARL
jgi:endoglucanase